MTSGDLITRALRLLGVIASGETPAADELTDGLTSLNALVNSWRTEELSVFEVKNLSFSLSASTGSYTIGPGGTFDTTRPVKVERAGIVSNSLRQPMEVVTWSDWSMIAEKNLTGLLPLKLYYDPAYPLGTVNVWPRPSGTPTLDLYVWFPLAEFAATSTTFEMPPGYQNAIVYNLAVDIAPEYGVQVPSAIIARAKQYKDDISILNAAKVAEVSETVARQVVPQ